MFPLNVIHYHYNVLSTHFKDVDIARQCPSKSKVLSVKPAFHKLEQRIQNKISNHSNLDIRPRKVDYLVCVPARVYNF